jgi:hypothetical protein
MSGPYDHPEPGIAPGQLVRDSRSLRSRRAESEILTVNGSTLISLPFIVKFLPRFARAAGESHAQRNPPGGDLPSLFM